MFERLGREIGEQLQAIREAVVTREFWIYVGAILAIGLVGVGGAYFALGFDNLTRDRLMMVLACQTGEKQLAVIIVGSFVFCIAAFFALGEVAAWVEEWRRSKVGGWKLHTSPWRPVIAISGALLIGIAGAALMSFWCM